MVLFHDKFHNCFYFYILRPRKFSVLFIIAYNPLTTFLPGFYFSISRSGIWEISALRHMTCATCFARFRCKHHDIHSSLLLPFLTVCQWIRQVIFHLSEVYQVLVDVFSTTPSSFRFFIWWTFFGGRLVSHFFWWTQFKRPFLF